jgi:formylglycine-generating enzyme required for sulfatase activity
MLTVNPVLYFQAHHERHKIFQPRFARFLQLAVVATCLLAWSIKPALADIVFDWAVVGNPGNAPDQDYGGPPAPGRFGAVNYTYRISRHEVTNAQYAEFLNRVAASDPHGLFNSGMDISRSGSNGSFTYSATSAYERKPVHHVSFLDAMRFTNWLHNGQGTGGTESGVYTVGSGASEIRSAGARYFIPSEDEWYKAAYYDPRLEYQGGPPGDDNYWFYATQHDNDPLREPPPGGENSANYNWLPGHRPSDVGAYVDTTSFYGTFDQAGNIREWTEGLHNSAFRITRGGSWRSPEAINMSASHRWQFYPNLQRDWLGFRVASAIPEPGSLLLVTSAMTGLLLRRRR